MLRSILALGLLAVGPVLLVPSVAAEEPDYCVLVDQSTTPPGFMLDTRNCYTMAMGLVGDVPYLVSDVVCLISRTLDPAGRCWGP